MIYLLYNLIFKKTSSWTQFICLVSSLLVWNKAKTSKLLCCCLFAFLVICANTPKAYCEAIPLCLLLASLSTLTKEVQLLFFTCSGCAKVFASGERLACVASISCCPCLLSLRSCLLLVLVLTLLLSVCSWLLILPSISAQLLASS
jgi:hypothetical protein